MSWYLKSAGFKILSALPGGGRLYTFAQEHVTRSTTASRRRVEQKIGVGLRYWEWLKTHGHRDTFCQATLLDFGAGWHPTIPLLFYSLGAPKQILLDVAPLLDARKAEDTLRIFCEIVSDPANAWRQELVRLPEVADTSPPQPDAKRRTTKAANEIIEPLGITYYGPYANTYAPSPASVDLVFCTQVLQHLGRETQLEVLRWLHSSLKPGGLLLATIHLVGQFGNPHQLAGRYEHLKFSPWVWEKVLNSSMMSFNRLKAPDYREIFAATGFKLREFEVEPPTSADLEELARTPVHPSFNRFSPEEQAAKHVFVVAEKAQC